MPYVTVQHWCPFWARCMGVLKRPKRRYQWLCSISDANTVLSRGCGCIMFRFALLISLCVALERSQCVAELLSWCQFILTYVHGVSSLQRAWTCFLGQSHPPTFMASTSIFLPWLGLQIKTASGNEIMCLGRSMMKGLKQTSTSQVYKQVFSGNKITAFLATNFFIPASFRWGSPLWRLYSVSASTGLVCECYECSPRYNTGKNDT